MKPIAWYDPTNGMVSTNKDSPLFTPLGQVWPLYTEQEDDGITLTTIRHPRGKPALGDLNPESLDQVEIDVQEPVAWMVYTQDGHSVYVTDNPTDIKEGQRALPLYTTTPQRQWVGLTDEDLDYLCHLAYAGDEEFALTVQARLKEKNT